MPQYFTFDKSFKFTKISIASGFEIHAYLTLIITIICDSLKFPFLSEHFA